ncbi:MAG: aminoacyl-tRNA hydrolase [Proteobacteria bacterium]|nr:aminoacyl-tRNA hydrolase [Pseudomonadota bacterium]
MSFIRLIVGLGNPGREYESTRHNAGFWWLDDLSKNIDVKLGMQVKHHALVGQARVEKQDVWLVKPQTFMNDSGLAVGALSRFYHVAADEILVVHDELDLPPGVIRLKQAGGHGGHNGLRSIIASLGSSDFWRLRIGIGHPGSREKVLGYVLGRPGPVDLAKIEGSIRDSLPFLAELSSGKMDAVMQVLNRRLPQVSDEGNP